MIQIVDCYLTSNKKKPWTLDYTLYRYKTSNKKPWVLDYIDTKHLTKKPRVLDYIATKHLT